MRPSFCLFACLILGVAPAAADPAAFKPSGMVEVGGNFHSLSDGFSDWLGQYAKGEMQTDPANRWNLETLHQREFDDSGFYGAIGNTHTFNRDWYSAISIGAGTGAFFLPDYRVDAFLNRKWLAHRQLVTTLGIGFYNAKDEHHDQSIFLGATYYFEAPWIVQAGVRFNNSSPGSVNSFSEFVALTQGENKKHFITFRYGFGEEAYQLIGPAQALSDFNSQQASVEVKKWLEEDWGFTARVERYHNPNYDRTGVSVGLFREF